MASAGTLQAESLGGAEVAAGGVGNGKKSKASSAGTKDDSDSVMRLVLTQAPKMMLAIPTYYDLPQIEQIET